MDTKRSFDEQGDKKHPGSDRWGNLDIVKNGSIARDILALQEYGCHEITPYQSTLAERLALRYPKYIIGAYQQRVKTIGKGIEILQLPVEKDYLAFRCLCQQPPDTSDYAPQNLNANLLVTHAGGDRCYFLPESIAYLHQVAQQQEINNLTVSLVRYPLQTAAGQVLEPFYVTTGFTHKGTSVIAPVVNSLLFRPPETLSDEEREALYINDIGAYIHAETANQTLVLRIPKRKTDRSPTHRALTNPELSGLPKGTNFLDVPNGTYYFLTCGDQQKNAGYAHTLMQDDSFLQRCDAIMKAWLDNYYRKPREHSSRVLLLPAQVLTGKTRYDESHKLALGRVVEDWKRKQA